MIASDFERSYTSYQPHRYARPLPDSTRLRLRVQLPPQQQLDSTELSARYGLAVSVSQTARRTRSSGFNLFDLELEGTVAQIQQTLAYLQSVSVAVHSRPNADGDGWDQ
jgi:hypothetical protein